MAPINVDTCVNELCYHTSGLGLSCYHKVETYVVAAMVGNAVEDDTQRRVMRLRANHDMFFGPQGIPPIQDCAVRETVRKAESLCETACDTLTVIHKYT